MIGRGNGWMRYLLAPWISDIAVRDLLAAGAPAHGLHVAPDGVTDRIPTPPAADAGCGRWPVAQFRSSTRIVDAVANPAFLLTDLDDLVPVHLTYLPPPPSDDRPGSGPREATDPAALAGLAHTACQLRSLRGAGVRSVNTWAFASQQLPENGGSATWVCTRADTWRGPGSVTVQFLPPATRPADPGRIAGRAANTAACSRFGPHVVGDVHWQAKSGKWYLLAAGSREVGGIDATGGVRATGTSATLAAPAGQNAAAEVVGRLRGGGSVRALRP